MSITQKSEFTFRQFCLSSPLLHRRPSFSVPWTNMMITNVIAVQVRSWGWFDVKMPSLPYKRFHCWYKTSIRPSYPPMGLTPLRVRWHLYVNPDTPVVEPIWNCVRFSFICGPWWQNRRNRCTWMISHIPQNAVVMLWWCIYLFMRFKTQCSWK